ncbi:MAG: glycosyltransferase [Planctomycetaceae bacterium]|nr:glycosyltransferase [Planctomycetaceae bacterium]
MSSGHSPPASHPPPRVSVLLVTYNHAPYIAQAVESVLAQQGHGGLELVIGEDCSTDHTRAILQQFADRNPDRIRLLVRQLNLGLSENLRSAWRECRGDYIAMLEGDDYWTDPLKLHKQVAALDAHPGWTMCFHRIQVTNEAGQPPFLEPQEDNFPVETTLADILRRNFIGNVSTVYRRGVVPEVPDDLQRVVHQDWPLHVLHAQRGTIGYLPDSMGVWRHHAGSMWSSKPEAVRWQWIFEFYDLVEDLLGAEHRPAVRSARLEAVRKLCADRDRALMSRDYRYGAALLQPLRAIRKWLH